VLALLVVVAAVGFWAFRPDTLVFDDAVDESLAEAFVPSSVSSVVTPPVPEDPVPEEPVPESGPRVVARGTFTGIDHRASGRAAIYEQDGVFVLRFEDDTDIQNGPDLYVWLLPADGYDGGTPSEFIDLGRLKGNVGGQNYELPAGFEPDRPYTVLVWCLRFSVPFAAAPLG